MVLAGGFLVRSFAPVTVNVRIDAATTQEAW